MKNYFKSMLLILFGALLAISAFYLFKYFATPPIKSGQRVLEMKVDMAGQDLMIWKTVIAKQQVDTPGIALHRHEYARILIPLTTGILQRRDADEKTTHYVLEIGKPLFLPEDTLDGFHTDENLGTDPIEVIVLQFTQAPIKIAPLVAEDLQMVMDTNTQ